VKNPTKLYFSLSDNGFLPFHSVAERDAGMTNDLIKRFFSRCAPSE